MGSADSLPVHSVLYESVHNRGERHSLYRICIVLYRLLFPDSFKTGTHTQAFGSYTICPGTDRCYHHAKQRTSPDRIIRSGRRCLSSFQKNYPLFSLLLLNNRYITVYI